MKKIVLLILFAMVLPKNLMGQYRLQNKEELNGFNSIPKEKVFIHFNDNLLLSGEYLYYKFYCRNPKNNTPTAISKIGYVELVDKNGASVFKHKIRLKAGVGQGDFFIPGNMTSGHYKLTGYTQWMLNEGVESIFIDDVIIINPYRELPQVVSSASSNILKLVKKDSTSHFNDSIIFSNKTNSYFQIDIPKRTFGKRKPVKFKISYSESDIPKGHYSISIRKKDNIELLSKQTAFDFVSGLSPSRNTKMAKIKEHISYPKLQGELISGKIISKTDSLPLSNQYISLSISGNDDTAKIFRSDTNGIFHFNLNESSKNNDLILQVIGDKKDKSKIILDSITPSNKKSSDVVSELTNKQEANTIKINDQIYLPELRGELISGKILSNIDDSPISNQDLSLSVSGDGGIVKISRSDANGVFYFNLYGSDRKNEVILEILGANNNQSKIILDAIVPLNLKTTNFKDISVSPDLNPILQERGIFNQIENAFFEQKEDSIIRSANNPTAYKDFQETYDLDDFTRFKTLPETIVEIIEDVLVKKRKGQYRIQVRGTDKFFIDSDAAPLMLIDNILVQNATDLFEYDVKKIKRIGISRNDFYIGPKKYQGIFSIETEDDDYLKQINSESNNTRLVPRPIPTKKYHFQDYSEMNSKSTEHFADFRQQLLWLPSVIVNKKETYEFYTSDNKGAYEISIEGFTERGRPVSVSEKIYVE